MLNLLKNRFIFPLQFLSFALGCTTPSYKVLNQSNNRTELLVTPERILLECEDVQDPTEPMDSDGRYGFMIHVLDDENTVLTVSQGSVLAKKDCFERINKIKKILRNGKQIYIGGMGDLRDPRKKREDHYTFLGKGSFYSNSRVLQFSVIKNEKDECFSAYYGNEKPCPRDEFPIANNPL